VYVYSSCRHIIVEIQAQISEKGGFLEAFVIMIYIVQQERDVDYRNT